MKFNFNGSEITCDPNLQKKLDIMIERCTKRKFDNLIIVEGPEGYGKSTITAMMAAYCSTQTGRQYDVNRVFFDPTEMMNFALNSQDQIVHWDEAVLGAMGADWQKSINKKIIKMLMMARKKRHIYFLCIPKFYKLNEYVIDRAVAMIRVYAKHETELGRFVYYNKQSLKNLYDTWKTKKRLNYKYYTFHGRFSDNFSKIIDETIYEKKKDEAIASILEEDEKAGSATSIKLLRLQYFTTILADECKKRTITKEEVAKILNVSRESMITWRKIAIKYPKILEKGGFEQDLSD